MEAYEKILKEIPGQVSFGFQTIRILRPAELKPFQVGFSVTSSGKTLVGEQEGDWREHWLVIGYEELAGDPIFIDISKQDYPAYTAMHGAGRWDPKPIAISLEGLKAALLALEGVSKGREFPTALEKNPLADDEKRAFLRQIQRHNPGIDLEFWTSVVDDFQ